MYMIPLCSANLLLLRSRSWPFSLPKLFQWSSWQRQKCSQSYVFTEVFFSFDLFMDIYRAVRRKQ